MRNPHFVSLLYRDDENGNSQGQMEIRRDTCLNKLISKRHNGLIKVITGVRRCGKSYMLFPTGCSRKKDL